MIKVGVFGANGRMGRVLIDAAYQHTEVALGFASVREGSSFEGLDAGELAGISKQFINIASVSDSLANEADIMIDFTLPEALYQNLDYAIKHNNL